MVEIKGFEDYLINENGVIYSTERKRTYVWKGRSVSRVFPARKINPHPNPNGYLMVNLLNGNCSKRIALHRLLAIAFLPNPEGHPCVNHKDGNRTNNALSNLEWCTYKENIQHAWDTGLCRSSDGADSPKFKSPIQAEKMFRGEGVVLFGKKQLELAGFDNANVYRCCAGKQRYHRGYTFNYLMMKEVE